MTMSPVIAVHLTASIIALVTGPLVIFARLGSKKMPRIHRAFGYGWASMMILSAISALFIRDYGLPNVFGYTPIHLLVPFTAYSLYKAFKALLLKDIVNHKKTMVRLYWGACVGAGIFTLLPNRYLGNIVWTSLGFIA